MRAALVLGVVATLSLSAAAASAQEAVYPRHGYAPHGYGYHYSYGYHHPYVRRHLYAAAYGVRRYRHWH